MCFMKENMKILQDRLLKEMVNQLSSLGFSNGIINHAFFLLMGSSFTGFVSFWIERRQF